MVGLHAVWQVCCVVGLHAVWQVCCVVGLLCGRSAVW